MNRREFLEVSGLTAFGIGISPLLGSRRLLADPPAQPNILLIMTDQQTAGAMSCVGNPYVSTPNMDRIAANGVVFEKAYSSSPICQPFRTSMMTGMMPHETGVTDNGGSFSIPIPPLMGKLIKDAGYVTCWYGKWHATVSTSDISTHGFDTIDYTGPNDVDRYLETPCIIFIAQAGSGNPWFLVASFVNPHDICEFARDPSTCHRNDHPSNPIPEPPGAPYTPLSNCPPLPANHDREANQPTPLPHAQSDFSKSHKHYPAVNVDPLYPGPDGLGDIWGEEAWRYYLYGYYRMVEDVDARIGTLLDALEATGQDTNTVVIFLSDHGEGMAAHKWNQKTALYDESARVPFIISYKGVTQAGVIDSEHLVSPAEDIIPTLCDYAGATVPAGLRGRSVRPLAEGQQVAWRDEVVCETDFYGGVQGRMVRTKRYKYTCYYATNTAYNTQREELIDMEADPGEMNNLVVDPDYAPILENMRWRLKMWCQETSDTFPIIEPDFARCDLSQDGAVDMEDFAQVGDKWKKTDGVDCGGADFNGDGEVSEKDISEFTEHWLDGA